MKSRKRPWWQVAIGGVVLLLVVAFAGPRTCVREPDAKAIASAIPGSLAALPAWIAAREAEVGAIDSAMTKRVTFAGPAERTPYSVVYLHGFSASRQETAPLAEEVARELGANLFETRLHGHGMRAKALADVSVRDWLADATEALEIGARLGDSVIVIGTSTGGTLGMWLATREANALPPLRALVLISPNFGTVNANAEYLMWPWASVLYPMIAPEREWTPRNDEQARYWHVRYSTKALFPMQALVEHVRARPITGYSVPTLVFFNSGDQVVDATRTAAFMDRIEATSSSSIQRVQVLPTDGEDGHVLAGRIVAPSQTETFRDRIVQFVRQ